MRRVSCIWLWFGTMVRLARLLNLVAFAVVIASAEETSNNRQNRQSEYEQIGVASVAGITSRNGRISSTGRVHFYPTDGVSTTGDGFYNPVTFSKAINGKYASGSVQIHPGALGVSSSAQAGYDPGFNWPISQWPRQNPWPVQWPVQNQFYAPFGDPWFSKENELPHNNVRRRLMYPSFNPFFNFWR